MPKTNTLNGRRVTTSEGDAHLIKKSIASGMLGGAETSQIRVDVVAMKTGGYVSERIWLSTTSPIFFQN